jgi:hypothetical protein
VEKAKRRGKNGGILLPVRALTKICMTSVQIDMGWDEF